jgi:hypothetical protein
LASCTIAVVLVACPTTSALDNPMAAIATSTAPRKRWFTGTPRITWRDVALPGRYTRMTNGDVPFGTPPSIRCV